MKLRINEKRLKKLYVKVNKTNMEQNIDDNLHGNKNAYSKYGIDVPPSCATFQIRKFISDIPIPAPPILAEILNKPLSVKHSTPLI